ncbi:MAG TPA: DinB family protein [Thermoanaerobaculia bacterium]|jgi:uncharacterized damage-inducible protein DinB
MTGVPERDEYAPYYQRYVERVGSGDIVDLLARQTTEDLAFWRGISEEKARHRYAPEKWSVREVLNHVSDTERVFLYRALWFARGFESELPSFDQDVSSRAARAEACPWASVVEEFRAVREGSVAFFRNLPTEAWTRRGVASGNPVSVRALAYIVAGHASHHRGVVEARYL